MILLCQVDVSALFYEQTLFSAADDVDYLELQSRFARTNHVDVMDGKRPNPWGNMVHFI